MTRFVGEVALIVAATSCLLGFGGLGMGCIELATLAVVIACLLVWRRAALDSRGLESGPAGSRPDR